MEEKAGEQCFGFARGSAAVSMLKAPVKPLCWAVLDWHTSQRASSDLLQGSFPGYQRGTGA